MKEELEKMEVGGKGRSVVVPFLVGGLVGAGIALLLAPKSGRETRADIKDLAVKTKENDRFYHSKRQGAVHGEHERPLRRHRGG